MTTSTWWLCFHRGFNFNIIPTFSKISPNALKCDSVAPVITGSRFWKYGAKATPRCQLQTSRQSPTNSIGFSTIFPFVVIYHFQKGFVVIELCVRRRFSGCLLFKILFISFRSPFLFLINIWRDLIVLEICAHRRCSGYLLFTILLISSRLLNLKKIFSKIL